MNIDYESKSVDELQALLNCAQKIESMTRLSVIEKVRLGVMKIDIASEMLKRQGA